MKPQSQQRKLISISGFFSTEELVRDALTRLLEMGIPRDLIEVIIKKEDEDQFFVASRKRRWTTSVSSVGRGALAGLIVFAFISAGLIVFNGAQNSARLTWIMILGPNMGVILGGAAGFLWRLVKSKQIPKLFERLGEHDGILLIVSAKLETEAEQIYRCLRSAGAEQLRMDA